MKTYRSLVLPFLTVAALLSAADSNPGPKIYVNIVGEVFAPDHYTAPTPQQPAYYVLHDAGFVERGDAVANDNPPAAADITGALARYLPAANFVPATADHAPSLLLIAHWGVLREDSMQISPPYEIQPSLRARIRLVATPETAKHIERELTDRIYRSEMRQMMPWPRLLDSREQDILDNAREAQYFVMVTAYDYAAAVKKQIVPVWRLKLSTDTRGSSMPDALPALIRNGRTYFGQNTAEAINEKLPLLPRTEVKLDDLKFLEAIVPADAPISPDLLQTLQQAESADLAGAKAKPAEEAKPAIPTALNERIEAYRAKKLALQNELKARLDQAEPGADTAKLVEAFNQQQAGRIAALNRERDALRTELARLTAANTRPGDGKSLQALLDEFATATY